jgi:phage gp29-like protein
MRLVDAYGKEIRSGRPVTDEIGVGGIRTRYSSYPTQGLTPERLTAIFREADAGDVLRQAELFEEMEEKDAHLAAVLQTRKLAVAGLPWEVTDASPAALDQEVAAFVREVLAWTPGIEDAFQDLLDAIGKGFSILEALWEVEGGRVWLGELRWRHQKGFTFRGREGVLDTPRLLTEDEPVWGEELIPRKFLVHRYRSRSGLAPRGGLLRPCAWLYLFKNYTVKDWVVFGERYAQPLRVGKFSAGATEQDRAVLRDAVFNLGSDAAAIISDSTVIEMLGAEGRGASVDVYSRMVEFCDRSISKAVLGHTGSAESSPGRLGGEQEAREVRRDLVRADARALGSTITHQLIAPLVAFNFGPEASLPLFRFRLGEEE